MKKVLCLFLAMGLISSLALAADINDWKRGDASIPVKGTDNISDADTLISNYIVDPLDKILTEYIHGCTLTYATAATVTISTGEVTCWNAAKTIKRMRRNTSTVTITLPANGASGDSLDTGNAATSTWYHVYAVADADATTFTGICSASASAPTGVTYFRYLGSFYNGAGDDIASFYWSGTGVTATIMWNVPVNITTTTSSAAWSAATSCATGMPSTSTCGIFGLGTGNSAGNEAAVFIRPNGSTWAVNPANGVGGNSNSALAAGTTSGQRICITDSSQQIQYYDANPVGSEYNRIDVEGFIINR